jgi:hypothetical protein
MSASPPIAAQKRTSPEVAEGPNVHFALQEKQRPFSASDHHEVGHRPASQAVISFLALQRARSDWGRVKWQSTSADDNLYSHSVARQPHGRSPRGRNRANACAHRCSRGHSFGRSAESGAHGAFLQGLQQLGWIDGRSVRIDTRWPAGDAADTRKYAAELVALSPDGSRATNLRRSLHVGFSRKHVSRRKPPRRFGRIADTTTDPESSKSGNGDLQHLREMTLRSA